MATCRQAGDELAIAVAGRLKDDADIVVERVEPDTDIASGVLVIRPVLPGARSQVSIKPRERSQPTAHCDMVWAPVHVVQDQPS